MCKFNRFHETAHSYISMCLKKCLLGSEGMNQRNGTDIDAANAMKVFSKLGYKVKIYNDQTVEQMKQILISGKFCCRIRNKQTNEDLFFYCLSQKSLYSLFLFFSIEG